MSLHITIYGPKNYFWKPLFNAWARRPDEYSTGGIGFRIPFLQVAFFWGKE